MLFSLLAEHLNPDLAERLMTALAGCLAGALVGIGMIAAVQYANVTLLLTALWLLMESSAAATAKRRWSNITNSHKKGERFP